MSVERFPQGSSADPLPEAARRRSGERSGDPASSSGGTATWLPGEVPEALGPPPRLEDVRDDVEQAWLTGPADPANLAAPPREPSSRAADAAALAAVGLAAVTLVVGTVAPGARRVAELSRDGLAAPGVVPALVAVTLAAVVGAAVFVRLLMVGTTGDRSAGGRRRCRVLAWVWAAAVLVLAGTRVTGTFPVFGDALAGALEVTPAGHLVGLQVPKVVAVGLIWAALYCVVVAPGVALLFAWLEARGKVDGVEVLLTRSGLVLEGGAGRQSPDPSGAPADAADGGGA